MSKQNKTQEEAETECPERVALAKIDKLCEIGPLGPNPKTTFYGLILEIRRLVAEGLK